MIDEQEMRLQLAKDAYGVTDADLQKAGEQLDRYPESKVYMHCGALTAVVESIAKDHVHCQRKAWCTTCSYLRVGLASLIEYEKRTGETTP